MPADDAKAYNELVKIKTESLWKRREITWRTNFVLWAALCRLIVGIYREQAFVITNETWNTCCLVFIILFGMHAWHWIGAYVSDEIEFSWIHYFQDMSRKELGFPFTKDPEEPTKDQGCIYHLITKPRALRKVHAYLTQIIVTATLMGLVLFLLDAKIDKAKESSCKPHPSIKAVESHRCK